MVVSDTETWLGSLSEKEQLHVFKMLSGYLSVRELKTVMSEVEKGRSLLDIHRSMGMLGKYQVDLLRIRRKLKF